MADGIVLDHVVASKFLYLRILFANIKFMKGVIGFPLLSLFLLGGCTHQTRSPETSVANKDSTAYPLEILDFIADKRNPVFKGTDTDTWDEKIRERGYILREDGVYHLWYTGYRDEPDAEMHLGYATSNDGINWKRYENNPIYDSGWMEDMMVGF